MSRCGGMLGNRKKLLLGAAGLLGIAMPLACGLANAIPRQAQSQAQSTAPIGPNYKYEVVSVKPSEPGACRDRGQFCRPTETPDGFHAVTSLRALIQTAYGVFAENQISGAPSWVSSAFAYEVDARMDEVTADALKELSPDVRKVARRQMLQTLLAERFKMVIHRETKELPVYSLFVGKSGTKLQQSSPDFTLPNGNRPPAGTSGALEVYMDGPDTWLATGIGVTMDDLRQFSWTVGRPILDKTGLTGKYDFAIRFSAGDSQSRDAVGGGTDLPSPPSDTGEFLVLRTLRMLGFRVESVKAPVEIIVIDHVERPSGN